MDGGPDGGAASCPAGFTGRYLFVNQDVAWRVAELHCKSLDPTPNDSPFVHLAVVSTAAELVHVGQLADPENTWLGYTNTSGSFKWISTESTTYSNWDTGEPGSDGCAYLSTNGFMFASDCATGTHRFVCECDQFPEDPNNF